MNNKINQKDERPLSPHLQIYKWNISSLTSIAHRFSGVVLYLSIVLISWYVVLFTYNIDNVVEENCECDMMKIFGYIACAASFAVILALYYHFCNGIRHLFWDIGKGFELETAKKTGYLVIIASFLLTFLTIAAIAYFKFM